MAHCPPDRLADLEDVFAAVRTWPLVKEKSVGVFYVKAVPFLHFHVKNDERWADVKSGKAWVPLAIPFDAGALKRRQLKKQLAAFHAALAGQ